MIYTIKVRERDHRRRSFLFPFNDVSRREGDSAIPLSLIIVD